MRGPLVRIVAGSSPRIIVRSARRAEVSQVLAMNQRADAEEHRLIPDIAAARIDRRLARRYWLRTIRNRRSRLFVAVRRTRVIGMVAVDLRKARSRFAVVRCHVYLHSLFVSGEARGAGLAQALTRVALDWGRGRGAIQARLEMAEPNVAARGLYQSLGFQRREAMLARPL